MCVCVDYGLYRVVRNRVFLYFVDAAMVAVVAIDFADRLMLATPDPKLACW